MSAMENMVKTIINALGVDVDELKKEVISRVVAFENNVDTLNKTLILHAESQHRTEAAMMRIEHNLERMLNSVGEEYERNPTAKPTENENGHAGNENAARQNTGSIGGNECADGPALLDHSPQRAIA